MKHFQRIRKLTAALLITVLLIASVPTAYAASFSAYVTASSMAVYSNASLSDKLGSLSKYTVVTVKDYSGGVAKISYNGKTGYAKVSSMKAVDSVAKDAYLSETAKIYKSASTSSASTTLSAGTKVSVITTNGGWALIEKGGAGAYIQTKYLTDSPYTNPIATPAPTEKPEVIAEAVVNASTKVYKKASTSSASIAVPKGMKVEIIAVNGDWAYIRNGGGTYAYIYKKYLSDPNAATPTPTAKPTEEPQAIARAVVNAATKVYKKASTSSTSASIAKGTKVEIIAVNGDWAYIRNAGGTYAYIYKKYLSDPNAATPTPAPTATPDLSDTIPATVTVSSMKVYEKANTSSEVLGRLKKGAEVNVIRYNTTWAYIERSGNYGYCKVNSLTKNSELHTATPTPTAEPEAIADAVVNANAKVYKKASTSSSSASISAGTRLEIIAVSGDWAYIRNAGGTYAYILKKYLSDPNAPTATPDLSKAIPATVTDSSVKVYKKASTSSDVVGTLKRGAEVNVVNYNSTWAFIELKGNYGYCKLSALTKNSDLKDAEYKTLDEPVEAVVVSTTTVYEKANTRSPSLGSVKKGAELVVTACTTDGKLAKIKLGSKTGWCALSALEIVKKDPLEGYKKETFGATVVTNDAKLYAAAGEGSGSKIPFGADVTVGAYNNDWAYVKYGSKVGFVPVSALSRSSFATLKKGSTGSSVSTLEKALLAAGYFDAIPDSNYDTHTVSAVQRFQSNCGLSQTGEANQSLQRMLYSGNGPVSSLLSTTLKSGSAGASVTRIQTRLYVLGYLSKSGSLDGDYGNTTTKAVTLFQNYNGISATGTADASTLRKLYSTSAEKLPSGKTPADVITSPNVTSGSQTSNSVYISASLASSTDYYSSSMSNAQKLEYVIYMGQNQLGKPYVYGATGTSSYDCSGFTQYSFKQIDIRLKRTAQMQGYDDTYSKISSVSSLKRGDLVFFNTVSSDGDSCDHAGIYLGSGWFIHASSGQAKVVVSNLSSGYYNRVFSWGRRVLG